MWRFGWNRKRVLRGTDIDALLVPAGYGTDPVVRAVCEAALEGDLGPGLTLLADTRDDHHARVQVAEALGRAAVERPGDVAELAEDGADQADVLLWVGHALLSGAQRRPAGSSQADRKGMEAALHEVRIPLDNAAELRPDDPAPWAALQTVAMGLGADRDEKDRLWREITDRAPALFPAHMTRVRALSPTRGGTTEEMFAAAGASADVAPEGDPLPAVLALAHAEHLRGEEKRLVAEGKSPDIAHLGLGRLHGEPVQELFDLARSWAEHAVPHVYDVQAHHLFGWAFHRAGMQDPARWHLGAVGRYACDLPWSFFGAPRVEIAGAMAELGVDPTAHDTDGADPDRES
ncbi:hypothetical protein [Nocardiopsis coralli]|uniref:hypothetical protein n=1 Tax=Nocardiopsis coralli TaxID=2772213 RepID=UPI001C1195E0|nr:hypothetical protein [Nocardiopsis coralli]